MKIAPLLAASLLAAACTKHMGDQPKIETFEGQPRQAPAGTVSIEDGTSDIAWPDQPTIGDLERGRERFDIFCSVCHGRTGEGDGMVVQRGYTKPPSFFEERLLRFTRDMFADTIKQGIGHMPSYADKISPADRHAIAFYIKALQLSRTFPKAKLDDSDRAELAKVKE